MDPTIDPRYFEVVPTPGENEPLMPGDLVYITYDLFQTGDWIIAYQIGKLETMLESDGRWQLLSYHYDEEANTLTVELRTKDPSELPANMQLAGVGWFIVGALTVLAAVVISHIADTSKSQTRVFRRTLQSAVPDIQAAIDDPDTSPEMRAQLEDTKADIQNALASGELLPTPGIGQGLTSLGGGLLWLGIAILAFVWFKAK